MTEKEDSFNSTRAELFEALGHPTRVKILRTLDGRSLGFSELKRDVGLESGGHLQFHLGKLHHLVRTNPEGSYELTDDGKEALFVLTSTANGTTARGNGSTKNRAEGRNVRRVAVASFVIALIFGAGFTIYYVQTSSQISSLQSQNASLQSQVQNLPVQNQSLFLMRLVATIKVGAGEIAVNPATNRIYVTSSQGISVVDGFSNAVIANTGNVTTGRLPFHPYGVAVNPKTNKIYVTNFECPATAGTCQGTGSTSSIFVMSGSTNTITSAIRLPAPASCNKNSCTSLAINPNTNRIYFPSLWSNSVFVLDGVTDKIVGNISVGTNPDDVAVDVNSNRVFVANYNSNTLSVIDGSTNAIVGTVSLNAISAKGPMLQGPFALSVNPNTNRLYVNVDFNRLAVIDESNGTVLATIALPDVANYLAVNPSTNTIYDPMAFTNSTLVIDGLTNKIIGKIHTGSVSWQVAINPDTNRVYVSTTHNSVSVIDGSVPSRPSRVTETTSPNFPVTTTSSQGFAQFQLVAIGTITLVVAAGLITMVLRNRKERHHEKK